MASGAMRRAGDRAHALDPRHRMRRLAKPARSGSPRGAAFSLVLGALLWRRSARPTCSASRLRLALLAIWFLVAVNDFVKLPPGWDGLRRPRRLRAVHSRARRAAARDRWLGDVPVAALLPALRGNRFAARRMERAGDPDVRVDLDRQRARADRDRVPAEQRVFPERDDLQKVAIAGERRCCRWASPCRRESATSRSTQSLARAHAAAGGPASSSATTRPLRDAILLGAVWGLALLAKATAALLAAPLSYALSVSDAPPARRWNANWQRRPRRALASAAVAGWFYLRNWIVLGTPFAFGTSFAGGSLPPGGFWWQEPGYGRWHSLIGSEAADPARFDSAMPRFLEQLLHAVGRREYGLDHPVRRDPAVELRADAGVGMGGRPAVCADRARRLECDASRAGSGLRARVQIGVIALATQIAAALLLFVRMPVYSQGKATYALALTPIFGLLAARGFDSLGGNAVARAAAIAAVGRLGRARGLLVHGALGEQPETRTWAKSPPSMPLAERGSRPARGSPVAVRCSSSSRSRSSRSPRSGVRRSA